MSEETTREVEQVDAEVWLKERLTKPRRVADLISEWVGGQLTVASRRPLWRLNSWEGGHDGNNGHWIKDLNAARARLGVEAKVGDDDCWYWLLPDVDLPN